MTWRGYILIRDIPNGWPNNLLWNRLHTIGNQDSSQPCERNHMRASLDGLSAIVEALFDDAEITRDALIQFVADAIGRNPGQVDASLNITLMGGAGCTWDESHEAVLAYLADHRAAWEPAE